MFFPFSPIKEIIPPKTVSVKNLVYYIRFFLQKANASGSHLLIYSYGRGWADANKAGLCPKGIYSWVKKQANKKLGLNLIILIDLNAIRYICISEMTHVQKLP